MNELIKNIEKAKAVNFRDLVVPEEGQIQSVTLTQKKGVGITVFSFGKVKE